MRVDRLLSILLILSNKGLVTGSELADHFEVSLRTIYRDMEKLGEAGIPVASTGGKGGGYYIMENYNVDNLFLNRNEVKALMPLMDNLEFLFGKNQQFNDIVLKLEKTYQGDSLKSGSLNINMSHFSMEQELKEYLFLMNKAIEESRLLEFDYINRNMESSRRIAEPIQIEFNHGEWFLTAFCRVRKDYRRFKLVRIRNLQLGDSFSKRDISNEELRKIFSEGYNKNSIKVIFKFTNRIGEHLVEYFAKDDIKQADDGSFIVQDYFPNDGGLIKFILGFGKDCEVLEPQHLREEMKNCLHELLDKY